MRLRQLVSLLVFLGPAVAGAQPSPDPTAPPPPPPLWSGKAELAYAATSGNTSTSSLGVGLDVAYRPAPWTVEGKLAYLRASSAHIVTAEALAGTVKGSRDLTPKVDAFVLAGYQRNTFSGINHRIGGDAGAGYKLLQRPDLLFRTEAAVGYTNESRTNGTTRNYATARGGLKLVWKFSKSADFTEEASFTEDLSDTANWILRNVASVSASMTSVFSLKLSYGLVYANEPVPGFKKTDTITSAAVVAKF
jgi:putative salt-induced outer membrane protein